jgi:hypothetical protein
MAGPVWGPAQQLFPRAIGPADWDRPNFNGAVQGSPLLFNWWNIWIKLGNKYKINLHAPKLS